MLTLVIFHTQDRRKSTLLVFPSRHGQLGGLTTFRLGLAALPILFSKKRRHYLTVEYQDEQGQAQPAIFEVGKNAIRVTLKTLEVRTGKKVEYEDEEARKAGNK